MQRVLLLGPAGVRYVEAGSDDPCQTPESSSSNPAENGRVLIEHDTDGGLTIGEISSQAGISEGTLRMWEARYGFPLPERLPSGHRRFQLKDLERVRHVMRAREEGLSLPKAIDRARQIDNEPRPSIYGALRDQFPYLHPQLLPKPGLIWLSRAIEDECCARSPRPVLFACFQRERFYRQVEDRWRTLAATAKHAFVLADFARMRKPRGAPVEVPIKATDPLIREWVVVCDAPELSACMAAWERPIDAADPRLFETIWTVEARVVREAARACCDLIALRAPDLVNELRINLATAPRVAGDEQLRAAVELATRIAAYASASQVAHLRD